MTYDEIVKKYTDPIREALMDFIYSDDSTEDALHLETIFTKLRCIELEMYAYESKIAKLEEDSNIIKSGR